MHGGEVMDFGCFCFRGELCFLDCNDICMCVVNKYFELPELVLNSIYSDLKYNEISLNFTAGFLFLCGVCSHVVVLVLSEFVSVSYVGALAVMCLLLFVLHVSMVRECEGDDNAGVDDGGLVMVSDGMNMWAGVYLPSKRY